MEKFKLSNRSMNMLATENRKRYDCYINGNWDDHMEFQTHFALGKAFASCMEARAKTGDYQLEANAERMHEDFITHFQDDEYAKYYGQLDMLIQNAQIAITEKPIEAEKQIVTPRNEKYDIKIKMDAFYDGLIVDHKTVSSFTKEEDYDKYRDQMDLYQYVHYRDTGEKLPAQIREILKKNPSLPTKKDDLLEMLPNEQKMRALDEKRKVQDIKNILHLHTTKDQVCQEISFDWSDEIIERAETRIRRAIIRAEHLQSLGLEDIL